MRRIDHFQERKISLESVEALLEGALRRVEVEYGQFDSIKILAEVLAIKFWHENWYVHVNASIEADDDDYVRILWAAFKSFMDKRCESSSLTGERDFVLYAELLGSLSEWISYVHTKVEIRIALQSVFKGQDAAYVERLIDLCKSPVR